MSKKIYDNPIVIDVQIAKYSKPSKKIGSKSNKVKINYLIKEEKILSSVKLEKELYIITRLGI